MRQDSPETKRLFIGGLFNGATPEDLKERFGKYGTVKSVDLKTKKNDSGEVINTFAFMDFDATPDKLKQCIDVFNRARWKGKELNIQFAKENFLDRLEKERKMESVVKLWSPEKCQGRVIGKDTQHLPLLKMKKDVGKTNALKFRDDDKESRIRIDQLTWQLDEKHPPSKLSSVKLSKPKKQAVKRKQSNDSDSIDSDSDGERNQMTNIMPSRVYDSDGGSRDSCDTDEIVRNAKSGKHSNANSGGRVKESSSELDFINAHSARSRPKAQAGVDAIAKNLAFSEYDDGFSCSPHVEKELASESDEDFFDLIKSGKIEKIKMLERSGSGSPVDSKTKSVDQEINITESTNASKNSETSKKRKRNDLENSKTKKQKINSPQEKQTHLKEDKQRHESLTLSTTEVSRKRKRSQCEEQLSNADSSKLPNENQICSISESSPAGKMSVKRKKNKSEHQVNDQTESTLKAVDAKQDKHEKDCKKNNIKDKLEKQSIRNTHETKVSPVKCDKQLGKPEKPELNSTLNTGKDRGSEPKQSQEISHSVTPIRNVQSMGFKDYQSFRYDPSAVGHEKFEIKETKQEKEKPKQKKEEIVNLKSAKLEVEVKKFAEVDASVVDAFKTSSDVPFSLGALFGSADDDNLSEEEEKPESKPVQSHWKKKPKVVVEENSDDDNDQQTESKLNASNKTIEGGFFYHLNDTRLKDTKFCREKDLEEIRIEWLERRPHLVEAYRMKKKKPLRPYGKAPQSKGKVQKNIWRTKKP